MLWGITVLLGNMYLPDKAISLKDSGATPDKFRVHVPYVYPVEFHGFTSRINSKGYHSLVPGLISIFLETVWVPLSEITQLSNRT